MADNHGGNGKGFRSERNVNFLFLFEISLTNQDKCCILIIESEVMDMDLLEIIEKATTIILNVLTVLTIVKSLKKKVIAREPFGALISSISISYPNQMKKIFFMATVLSVLSIARMDFNNMSVLNWLVIVSALLMWGAGINLYRKERK